MTRELLHCTLHVRDPRQRWVLSRKPAINPAFGIAEVIWILGGRNDSAFVNFWNPILPKFAGAGETYHGAYGHRIRAHFNIDQLSRACEVLTEDQDSRQVVIQIWDPNSDLPESGAKPRSADIPCNVCSIPKIRNGRLEWLQVMRSNDLYLGTPHNFIQFTTLQEIIAGWIGVEVGSYVKISDSLHLYENNIEEFRISNTPPSEKNTDNLALNKNEFEETFKIIQRAMNNLCSELLTTSQYMHIINQQDIPAAWHNLLLIAAADSARRRNWLEEAALAAGACTNPALQAAWLAWSERKAPSQPSEKSAP